MQFIEIKECGTNIIQICTPIFSNPTSGLHLKFSNPTYKETAQC